MPILIHNDISKERKYDQKPKEKNNIAIVLTIPNKTLFLLVICCRYGKSDFSWILWTNSCLALSFEIVMSQG